MSIQGFQEGRVVKVKTSDLNEIPLEVREVNGVVVLVLGFLAPIDSVVVHNVYGVETILGRCAPEDTGIQFDRLGVDGCSSDDQVVAALEKYLRFGGRPFPSRLQPWEK